MLSRGELLAFLFAGAASVAGVATSVVIYAALQLDAQGVGAVALVFVAGLPFGFAASTAALPIYFVLRRLRLVNPPAALLTGAFVGTVAAVWAQMPSLPGWAGAVVGGGAGLVWWWTLDRAASWSSAT